MENVQNEVEEVENRNEEEEKANLKGDYGNAALLLLLYLFQGIIAGIYAAVPILLQNRGVSYKEQAMYTLAFYPYSIKILWAPLVDSIYNKRIGRRKTWAIPANILMGIFLLLSAQYVNQWLGNEKNSPEVLMLAVTFFTLRMFSATQDVAVDGWALTMLAKRNIGHVGSIEIIGISGGWSIGYIVLLVFESTEFCNSFIFKEPQSEGLITLAGFMRFWGIVFLFTTILVAIFKKENSEMDKKLEEHPDYGIKKAYPTLWKVLNLKPIFIFTLFMLTAKVSFAACDAVSTLKLIEYGVSKDKIALLAIPMLPIQFAIPFIISRFTTGKFPMSFYLQAYKFRLIMSILVISYVFFTPAMISQRQNDSIPVYYYIGIVTVYFMYHIPFRAMSVADVAFIARISDPLIGGTYMTLLNTINNFGAKWPETLFLWLLDYTTWKTCIVNDYNETMSNSTIMTLVDNKCLNKDQIELCVKSGGICRTDIDGYYIEAVISVIYGLIFYKIGKKLIDYLESLPIDDWHVLSKNIQENSDEIEEIPLKNIN